MMQCACGARTVWRGAGLFDALTPRTGANAFTAEGAEAARRLDRVYTLGCER